MKKTIAIVGIMAMMVSLAACGKKETKVINSVEDLTGAKIGVQKGTTGHIYVADEYGDESTECYNSGFEAVQALTQGKIDAVIIDDQPAQEFVKQNGKVKILEQEFALEDYAIAIAKGNEDLKEKINTALKQIKEDGTFQASVDYYIGHVEGSAPYVKKDVERTNGTLHMATNAKFEPYEYFEGENIIGLDIDMAQAIADILGMELKVTHIDFDSIIPSVVTGKADIGVAGMTVTEERLENVDFSDTYYTGRQVIIVNK